MRSLAAAALLVIAALYGRVTQQPAAAVLLGIPILAAIPPGTDRFRLRLGKTAARLSIVGAAVIGLVVGWLVGPATRAGVLAGPWPALALAGLFAGTLILHIRRADPAPGEAPRADSVWVASLPGLVALMAEGETDAGPLYGAAVVAFLSLALGSLYAADRGRPGWRDLPRRSRLAALLVIAAATALAAGSAVGLPPLSRYMERRIVHALGGAETGFSDRMWLGSLDGLLDSNEVVMRIEVQGAGPRPDYLRGAVFDHYEIGRWGRMRPARLVAASVSAPRAGADRSRITVVSGARDRYFLPLGAADVSARGSSLALDRFGVLRVGEGLASEVSFTSRGEPSLSIDAPTEDDLDLPPMLRRPLGRIAEEWTRGAITPEDKLAAIVAHLGQGFTYSRTFERRRADPILDFLGDDRRGHCEYFATAVALLSRAAGLPARVVAGYRVAEENTVGGYWVVRERNAHAWAEVHLPDRGFVTVDATPADPLAQNVVHTSGFAGAVLDALSAWSSRAFARVTLLDLLYTGIAVLVLGLILRWIRRPRDRRARAEKVRFDPPPASLLRLEAALGKRGVARHAAEPIERFAARLDREGQPEAAEILRRWAAHRYGGLGDGAALAKEMDGCAARLGG